MQYVTGVTGNITPTAGYCHINLRKGLDLNKGYNGLSYQVSSNVSFPFCVTYSVVINASSDLPKRPV